MKQLDTFLKLEYPVTIYRAPEGGYVAEIEDLPGCLTEAETLEEAFERIDDTRRAWIELAYEDGMQIPLPRTENEYSGKFITRVSKSLHRRLVEQAEHEGISLNQYVECMLTSGITLQEVRIDIKNTLEQLRGTFPITNPLVYEFGEKPNYIFSPFTYSIRSLKEDWRKEQVAI